MKQIQRSSIILGMVSIALILKAMQKQNAMMILVAIFLMIVALGRYILMKKLMVEESDVYDFSNDFIHTYFNEKQVLYVEMRELYRRGNCKVLYEERDGLLLYDHTTMSYLASAKTIEGARDIVRLLPQDYGMFVAHEDVFEKIEQKEFPYKEKMVFYNYEYEKKEKFNDLNEEVTYKFLDESYLPEIIKHYNVDVLANEKYLKPRFKDGILGVFVKDTLAGFIGMHDNGAIGMLEIFPEYQNNHLGTNLEKAYINHLLDKNYEGFIYGQVMEDNKVSMHMQEKLGMKKSENKTIWYISK